MNFWYQHGSISFLLYPFSLIYLLVITLCRWLYHKGFLKTTRVPVPVVVVGNITVGGTGKTPLILCLATLLKEQGYQLGIVSRGYGGNYRESYRKVDAQSDPAVVGDEPVLLMRHLKCPMVVSKSRVLAAQKLLEQNTCDVILSDDGLQHYALARDIEIAVLDGERRFGNGFCLPAGPLRESVSRLKRVDFCITQGEQSKNDEFRMWLNPAPLRNLKDDACLFDKKEGMVVRAVAGIGHPERFFKQLEALGFDCIRSPFPDHHKFSLNDFDFNDNIPIIMTEKDAVKCAFFADARFWYLPVEACVDQAFKRLFLDKLNGILSGV